MTKQKQPSIGRAPLTTEELEKLKADDFVRLKLTEDEKIRLRAINESRKLKRAERSKLLRTEEQPIILDLRHAGVICNSIWDLVNGPNIYDSAIPILLKHLLLSYSDITREGIARALAIPAAGFAWHTLVEEYRKEPGIIEGHGWSAKDGLACALSATVTDATLEQLIALAKDRAHGKSRVLLLTALRKRRFKNSLVKQALEELANDPDLEKEIASWRKR